MIIELFTRYFVCWQSQEYGNNVSCWTLWYIVMIYLSIFSALCSTMRERCPYSELFWSVFSRVRTTISSNTETFYAVQLYQWNISFCKFNMFDSRLAFETYYCVCLKNKTNRNYLFSFSFLHHFSGITGNLELKNISRTIVQLIQFSYLLPWKEIFLVSSIFWISNCEG